MANSPRAERDDNRILSKERIYVEHVNRRVKIFRILAQRYRNRRKRYGPALQYHCGTLQL